jgi:hypothetical protein
MLSDSDSFVLHLILYEVNIVIFITLMKIFSSSLELLDQLGGIHLHGAPFLHGLGSFDGDIWLGESHFSLVG